GGGAELGGLDSLCHARPNRLSIHPVKFLCPACDRLLELSSFRVEGERLIVRCRACHAESAASATAAAMLQSMRFEPKAPPHLAAPAPAPEAVQVSDVFDAPEGYCPKCVSPRPSTAASCPQCGLVFANVQPGEFCPSEEVATQWRGLLQHWLDSESHDQ